MEVGPEIRRIREAKGLSQTKVAASADMSVSGLSQIETGARNPSAVTLTKLAKALEVEVGDLFPKDQAPLPFEDVVQRYSKVPGAIDDLIGQQAKARERELDDPNSPWFANLHIASLWLEMVSEEAGRLRTWVEKYAPILQPPSTTLSNRREFLVHNLQLVSHASMTYLLLYREAKKRIEKRTEVMNETPDDLARRRVEKADAGMQENERRLHELQEAASS